MILFKRNIQEKVDHRQQISLDDGKKENYKRKKRERASVLETTSLTYIFFYAYIKLIPPDVSEVVPFFLQISFYIF